ncbi:MAG: N-acetyl-gamma-glutamyl-phosphate reductase [Rickettsiales bacterium]|nr:N-acetyl-gamma-glutamyl-phosphate reductase [Rickettsiales bacterium]
MTSPIHAIIIGASGYTGTELIRLLHAHPDVTLSALVADSNAGKSMEDIYPHLSTFDLPQMVSFDKVKWDDVQAAFCCLPHSKSHQIIASIPEHVKIIDLSADFRFSDIELYEDTYGCQHSAPQLQRDAVYGLTELFRSDIENARIVACPGCYPTSVIIPLYPLIEAQLIDASYIIADSKSGMSGAGRKTIQTSLFAEINDGIKAYGISTHRHAPEMETILTKASQGQEPCVQFTPQIVPMNRGILSNLYIRSDQSVAEIRDYLTEFYEDSSFIHVLPNGRAPATREVYGTNQCRMGVFEGRKEGTIVISSVIDNLVKGASGQAVQNMNIMFGLDETKGLELVALFP